MKTLVVSLMLLLSVGCSTMSTPMNVVMTNPDNGQSVYISHWGGGIGAGLAVSSIQAAVQQKKAIEAARSMGYTEMKVVK